MKLPSWTYLVVFVIGIALCWYVMRGCEKEQPDHADLLQKNDSLVKANAANVAAAFKYKDSADRVISGLQNDKDSLTSIVVSYEKSLAKQSNDIGALIADLNDAEAKRDTGTALSKCDSLRDAVLQARSAVGGYIVSNDSLRKINDQIISSKNEIINRLGKQLTETNNSFFSTQLTLQKIEGDYNKVRISAKKRLGIGPSAGAFITNRGAGYGVGFTLHYDLIKF